MKAMAFLHVDMRSLLGWGVSMHVSSLASSPRSTTSGSAAGALRGFGVPWDLGFHCWLPLAVSIRQVWAPWNAALALLLQQGEKWGPVELYPNWVVLQFVPKVPAPLLQRQLQILTMFGCLQIRVNWQLLLWASGVDWSTRATHHPVIHQAQLTRKITFAI